MDLPWRGSFCRSVFRSDARNSPSVSHAGPNVQALLYGLMYGPVATLAMLPMTIYVGTSANINLQLPI